MVIIAKIAFIVIVIGVFPHGVPADSATSVAMKDERVNGSRVIVVDQGGKGDFRTVQQAIDVVPSCNTQSVTILVNPGTYREKVVVPDDKPFITLVGRDAKKTVITGNDSAVGSGTVESATFAALASDFQAISITFENTYGFGSQAVALRVSGNRSSFHRCRMTGYQDTLLDDKGTHYFSQCYIEGAMDFIFGNGQSIYHGCELRTNPIRRHAGAIVAQKRMSPDQNTGYVFLNCTIRGDGQVYLGRAWGPYSRVVFAHTYMEKVIIPSGWSDMGNYNSRRTVYFGQYQCSGDGAMNSGRVDWSHELTSGEVQPFLSTNFINGPLWIQRSQQFASHAT